MVQSNSAATFRDLDCPSYLHHQPKLEGDTQNAAAGAPNGTGASPHRDRPARSSTLSADFKVLLLTSKEQHQTSPKGSPKRQNNSNSPNKENRRDCRKEHRISESTRKEKDKSHRRSKSRSEGKNGRKPTTGSSGDATTESTREKEGHQDEDEASQSPHGSNRRSPAKQRRKSSENSPTQEHSQRRHHRQSGKHSNSRSPKGEKESALSTKPAEKMAEQKDEEPTSDNIISAETLEETTETIEGAPLQHTDTRTKKSAQKRMDPNDKSFGGFTAQLKTDEGERKQSFKQKPSSSCTSAAAATATLRVSRLGSHRSRSGRNLMASFRCEETAATAPTGRSRPVVRHHKSMDRRPSDDRLQNISMLSQNDSVSTSRRNKDSSSATPRRLFERSLSSEQLLVRTSEHAATATVTATTNGRGSSSGRKSLRRNHSGLEASLVQRLVRPSSPNAGLQW